MNCSIKCGLGNEAKDAGGAATSTYILRVGTKGFDIHGLNLIVMGPDDFAAAVH